MKRLYFHCDGSHIFNGKYCPQDGVSFWAEEILTVVERLERDGVELSVQALRAAGVPDAHLHRVLIIEFAGDSYEFDALEIAATQRNGTWEPHVEAVMFLQRYFGRPGYRPFPVERAGEPSNPDTEGTRGREGTGR